MIWFLYWQKGATEPPDLTRDFIWFQHVYIPQDNLSFTDGGFN